MQKSIQLTSAYGEKHYSITGISEWLASQEKNRIMWVGLILTLHACILTPVTLFTITHTGNILGLWIVAALGMVACMITNLAALPTKYTIPTAITSLIVHIGILVFCLI